MIALVWNRMQAEENRTKPALIASCSPVI